MNYDTFWAKTASCREDIELRETRKQLQFIVGNISDWFPCSASANL